MWKLWHKLFGWDYCVFSFAYSTELKRLKSFPDGTLYVSHLGKIKLASDLRDFKIITRV